MKMEDDAIVAMLQHGVGQSVGYSESRLAKEREYVLRHYDGERPFKAHSGDVGYWSLDVYDGIESMKAQLLEVFSGNGRPVEFLPAPGEPSQAAQTRTDYCTSVLFDQNRGHSILEAVIQDALMNRVGICKVWWDVRETTEHYDMTDAGLEELQAYLTNDPSAEIVDFELHEDGVTIKRARLRIKKDRSKVIIVPLPPEEFGISPQAKDIATAELVFHRRLQSASELIKSGYDKKIVQELQDNDRLWMATEPEVLARFGATDDMIGYDSQFDGVMPSRKRVMVYECYSELEEDDSGTSQLYKVVFAGDTILDKEPVDRKPFVAYCPLPRAHTFWGTNYGKQLIPTQTARTYLTRSIINHALTTNNPRLQVVRGAVANPRELLENRFGGIVNVTRPDGILPLPQAGLNPFVFQTIGMLDSDKEQITGISSLSQGLNKDAISKQNSQGMVQELISVSQIRQKIIARNFAENFLRDLYTTIYHLVMENESREKVAKISGQWTPIDFTSWPADAEMQVAFSLGYGESEKEAAKWASFDQKMISDPELKSMYPLAKRYNVIKKAAEAGGIKNFNEYVLTPDQVPPPTPDPMQQADLQVKQADAQVKQANAQAAVENLKLQQQEAQQKAQDALAKMQLQKQKELDHVNLEQAKLAHKVAVDAAELRLSIAAQQQDKLTAMAAPTRG